MLVGAHEDRYSIRQYPGFCTVPYLILIVNTLAANVLTARVEKAGYNSKASRPGNCFLWQQYKQRNRLKDENKSEVPDVI